MKFSFIAKLALVTTFIFTITSCEKDNVDTPETSLETRAPLSLDLNSSITSKAENPQLPQTIEELRDAGISVSFGLANFLSNDLNILLQVLDLDTRTLRRLGFFESEIAELEQIRIAYRRLVFTIENAGNIAPDPGTISRIRNASYVLGKWTVESFRINTSAGEDQLLTNDLSRISNAPAGVNGFEVSATEFKFTIDGVQAGEAYPIVEITENGSITYLKDNEVSRFYRIGLRNEAGDIFSATSLIPRGSSIDGFIVHHRFRRQ
ncbi:hypothetical protein AWE51_15340 [Aquimarina aggregata]|uniref:Uncharacterized protein n=1 Tax=Aquimarina aggregata TaxID=1642818 RepID=A0A163CTC4_9FLAO|nr:hypothetical protein [Aquimarina aggregata]KZS42745.1 hypothetical protein AWE51_15340 [Aquimarina aggregata]